MWGWNKYSIFFLLTYINFFSQELLTSTLFGPMLCYAKSLQSCPTLCDPRRQPTRLPRPWDSPGKNTGAGCHFLLQCTKVKSESEVAQLCPTLCDLMDSSPPGSSVHSILQARVLEWVAISFSNAWERKVKVKSLSCVLLLATPRSVAYQAPPSMGFSRQEYWSGVTLPSLHIYIITIKKVINLIFFNLYF